MASPQEQSKAAQGPLTYRELCALYPSWSEAGETAVNQAMCTRDALLAGFLVLDVEATAVSGDPRFVLSRLGSARVDEFRCSGTNPWDHKAPSNEGDDVN